MKSANVYVCESDFEAREDEKRLMSVKKGELLVSRQYSTLLQSSPWVFCTKFSDSNVSGYVSRKVVVPKVVVTQ